MFTFDKTDEGFAVSTTEGKVVCHVFSRTTGFTDDPNLRVQKRTVDKFPKEKWTVHFTAHRLTVPEHAELVKQIGEYQDE